MTSPDSRPEIPDGTPTSSPPGPRVRPKVVRIIGRLNVGGAARQACLLHSRLAGPFQTRLIAGSLAEGEEDMSYLLASEGGVVRVPQMSRKISPWSDCVAFWKIFRLLRRERPDIVHTHTAKAGALGRLAAWLAGVPFIVHTYHGNVFYGYFGRFKSRIFLGIERLLGRISTQVIAISDSQRQELWAKYRVVPQEKVALLPNGFELAQFSRGDRAQARRRFGLPAEGLVVGWAGRMVPVKDVQLLAQVIRRAAEHGSNGTKIFFLVVGDGTERRELESLIRGCGNARLAGWQQDMAPVWRASDLALLTSRNEGTPTTLIEAMAAGLPFVATCVGGVPDLSATPLCDLPDGLGQEAANGFLTSRDPFALLYCIRRIAEDPEGAVRKGMVGRTLALERFSASRLIHDMTLLYQDLLSRKRRVPSAAARPSGATAPQA